MTHCVDRIGDYLAGRLEPEELREIRAHLEECPACERELSWAEQLRDEAMRQGLRHIPPERLVELAESREATPSEPETLHLDACAACKGELDWARGLTDLPPSPPDQKKKHSTTARRATHEPAPRRWLRWAWAPALAAAAFVLFLLLPDRPDTDALRSLARVEPMPVRITRAIPEAGSFEELRLLGLDDYQIGDYAGARDNFLRALELEPDAATELLYLGSAELLLGNAPEAARHLRRAVEHAGEPRLREEALWQLANAELAGGAPGQASDTLERIIGLGGQRQAEAQSLVDRLP